MLMTIIRVLHSNISEQDSLTWQCDNLRLASRSPAECESDPVDEVVVDVHLLRRDVVEGDDRVGAAAGALLQLEGLVLVEPVVGVPLA